MTLVEALPILMFVSLALFLFTGFPVAFVLGGVGVAFAVIGMALDDWAFSWAQFGVIPSRIFGGISENLILTAVPMFIFMGTMLERSGIARDLLDCLQVLLRRVPGGLALAVTIMGTILAATTGIIGASVVMMSLLALPVMMRQQYSPSLAAGTVAASGTLGILIPPSIMLVIMADLLSKSVGVLFVAAVIPGFMLSIMYVIYIVVLCRINPSFAPAVSRDIGPDSVRGYISMLARAFLPPVVLIGCVLGSILGGIATPTEAAGVGAFGALILALVNLVILPQLGVKNFTLEPDPPSLSEKEVYGLGIRLRSFGRVLNDSIMRTGLTNAMLFGIFVGATVFSFVFRSLGGDSLVEEFIEYLGLGPWGLLFLLMGITFFLGFFFDWIEITLIVLPVFAPIVASLDFGTHVSTIDVTYWFAILLAINLQTSFLTPPFGFALFYLKAVAPPSIKMVDIYLGIVPFVLIQLSAVALVMAFPDLALWLPRMLLD